MEEEGVLTKEKILRALKKGGEEEEEVLEKLSSLDTSVKEYLEGLGLSERDYKRVMQRMWRKGFRKREASMESLIRKYEDQDRDQFAKYVWEQVKRAGSQALTSWYNTAKELEYFSPSESGTPEVDVMGMLRDAVQFFVENRDSVQGLREENERMSVALRLLGEKLRDIWEEAEAMDLYLDEVERENPRLIPILEPIRGGLERMVSLSILRSSGEEEGGEMVGSEA